MGLCGSVPMRACGMASEPGHMTQRSCAYFGARYVLGPIKDVLHVVHGPAGCLYYGSMVRGRLQKVVGTDLGVGEIVMGGLSRLKDALIEAFRMWPEKSGAFVYMTCGPGITGDDVEGVAAQVEKETRKKVVVIHCPGFSKIHQSGGHSLAYDALFRLIKPVKKAQEPTVNIIGEYNVAGETKSIRALLSGLGLRVNTVFTGDAKLEDISTSSSAHLNILICGSTGRKFARLMREKFGIPHVEASFYGTTATSRAVRKIADFFDLMDRNMLLGVMEQKFRALDETEAIRKACEGKKALVVLGAARIKSIGALLRELGFEIIGIASIFASNEDYRGICFNPPLTMDDPGDDEFEKLLRAFTPDLVVTNSREQWRSVKLGFPTLALPQEEFRGSFAGYEGFINFAKDVQRVLTAPVWRFVHG
ncbi:nitrogenase component 1 [Thermodesulforhabdus norvegica]|uniref:Nitrogenase molybdenum-cofactor synthesis protein NifE n=1 Tax=Thermodesulforhabdus norvegica TaxID=39841 RepID=A0A1I4UID5_9BACT|nr:nitrogenase component 1 [Thermodesulforhabdus norvegica]SFM88757.1 nitrogenase molybdenum-cofactor synthesis protein NifE [Thermodesulforhabdus norvegica]